KAADCGEQRRDRGARSPPGRSAALRAAEPVQRRAPPRSGPEPASTFMIPLLTGVLAPRTEESPMTRTIAVIAGAGPAGLTAALQLLETTDVMPLVFEAETTVGGLAKTINYKGNRMDIGGHRFFSKSSRVMQWWLNMLPLEAGELGPAAIRYRNMERTLPPSTAAQ